MRMLLRAGAVALVLCLTLGGCAQVQKLETAFQAVTGNVITPNAVYVAINAFDTVDAAATVYLKRPRCGGSAVICRDPAVTAKLVPLIRGGRADRNNLKAQLRLHPDQNISALEVYQDLGNTTDALTSLLAGK